MVRGLADATEAELDGDAGVGGVREERRPRADLLQDPVLHADDGLEGEHVAGVVERGVVQRPALLA